MLTNKIIVVTGGAGFLGGHFCTSVVEDGAIVVVADIDFEAASRVAEKICNFHPGMAIPALLNITNPDSVKKLVANVHQQFGRIDAVVNNAYPRNLNFGRKLEDVAYEDFCENIDLHLGGYFLISQQFAIYFREHGGGNIVNMSSIYGSMAPRFDIYEGTEITMPVEYAAIKSAIEQLTRYFAQYYKKSGIRVNSISPGGILDIQPKIFLSKYNDYCGVKGMLSPEDVVGTLLFLLSDKGRFITGQNIVVDDGFSL